MTLEQIKQAIEAGKRVFWQNSNYEVKQCKHNIMIVSQNNCIGLTWQDGTTLNGHESDFYCEDQS